MEIAGYIASTLMGVMLGMMGGGGSILTVPILVYFFQVSPANATGSSLFVVGLTALIGSAVYMKKGDIDYKAGLFFAFPSFLGVLVARRMLVPALPAVVLQVRSFSLSKDILIMSSFAALMIFAALSMIKTRQQKPASANPHQTPSVRVAIQGFIIGGVAGFVGAGGGFLILPSLVIGLGLSMRPAVGTSLLIIAVQSLLGFTGDVAAGATVDWRLLLSVAALAAGGIVAGSVFAHKVQERKLKTAFGWFVLIMGSVILLEQFRHF